MAGMTPRTAIAGSASTEHVRTASQNRRDQKRAQSTLSLASLNTEEKRCIFDFQCATMLLILQHQLGSTATLMKKLELVGHDIRLSATATSLIVSAISALHLIIGPTVGTLSDRFGRKPFLFADCIARLCELSLAIALACELLHCFVLLTLVQGNLHIRLRSLVLLLMQIRAY
eukprot:SAG31_NODE_1583_length_7828_cov_1.884332_6_plen_173_part_00